MDRLISSWQQIGSTINSYTYYSYDDMGRAYKSDLRLMGTTGGANLYSNSEKPSIPNMFGFFYI